MNGRTFLLSTGLGALAFPAAAELTSIIRAQRDELETLRQELLASRQLATRLQGRLDALDAERQRELLDSLHPLAERSAPWTGSALSPKERP